ncbi:MAG: transglutaminase domain-containing protein [Planctomycetota bacterium]
MKTLFVALLLIAFTVGCGNQESAVNVGPVANAPPPPDKHEFVGVLRPFDNLPEVEVTAKTRRFNFVYGVAITDLKPGQKARVWIPVATRNHDQEVTLTKVNIPGEYKRTLEKRYNNSLFYFEGEANEKGEIPIELVYDVIRFEVTQTNYEIAVNLGDMFLGSSSKVPVDDSVKKVILGDGQPKGKTLEMAKSVYDAVLNHMDYEKPADRPGWGNGDASWACDNGIGNCTDFHSVFISTTRNLEIPSKFEIGFPIPDKLGKGKVGGYHCWAKFISDDFWVPVDISEADKNPEVAEYFFGSINTNRILFSVGRDLQLQPSPKAKSVNYLVYPYVEVDGKPHEGLRKEFRYEDL